MPKPLEQTTTVELLQEIRDSVCRAMEIEVDKFNKDYAEHELVPMKGKEFMEHWARMSRYSAYTTALDAAMVSLDPTYEP